MTDEPNGQTSGGFEVPEGSGYAISFPHVDTTDSPSGNTLTPPAPAEMGLGGQPMLSLQPSQPSTPDAGKPASQPAQTPPAQPRSNPVANFARGAMAALSGGTGHPMDWARATLAGGLAAAANVGEAPAGGGFLYGLAKGAQGVQQQQRQEMLDQEQLQDKNVQRQMWNAQMAGETQRQQQAAAMQPYLEAEHKAQLQKFSDDHLKLVQEQLSTFANAGIKLDDFVEVRDQSQLSPAQKQGLTSHPPTLLAIPNGNPHSDGQDGAGVHLVPAETIENARIKKDMTVSVPSSDADGNPSMKQITISAGTPVMQAAAVIQGTKNQVEAQQKSLLNQANVQEAIAKNRSEQLKNEPPGQQRLDTFLGKTLPGYTHIQESEQAGLQAEAKDARTVAEFDKVQERALQLETLGTNKEIAQANAKANKDAAVKSELGKKGLDGINKTWTDPQHGFTQVQAQAEMTKNSIQAGMNGSGLATSLTPTMVVLGVNNFGQTHRISPAEAEAAGAPGGVAERFNSWITKASTGRLTPQLAKEGTDIMDNLIVAAHRKAITNTRVLAGNGGLDPSSVTVTDIHGNPDTLANQIKVSLPPNGAVGTMKATNGRLYWVSRDRQVLGPAE